MECAVVELDAGLGLVVEDHDAVVVLVAGLAPGEDAVSVVVEGFVVGGVDVLVVLGRDDVVLVVLCKQTILGVLTASRVVKGAN